MKTGRCMATLLAGCSLALAAPPETRRKPVTDAYHGVKVVDHYRWLEDWNNKDVQVWSESQNAYARSVLDKLPGVPALRTELTRIMAAKRTTHGSLILRGNRLFALRNQPPKQQPFLIVLPFPGQPSDAHVLVDPNEMDKKSHVAIDWFVPSPDGKLVAVSLSKGGSESGDVHIFDVASGKQVDAVIPRVQNGTAAGYLAWTRRWQGVLLHALPAWQRTSRGGHWISSSNSISTNSVPPARRTVMRSARSSRASPRSRRRSSPGPAACS